MKLIAVVLFTATAAGAAPARNHAVTVDLLARGEFTQIWQSPEAHDALAVAVAWMMRGQNDPRAIDRAVEVLEREAAGSDRDHAARALWLRARLEHVHRPVPDPAAAARWYATLAERGDSALAERARFMALWCDLEAAAGTSVEPEHRALAAAAGRLADPTLRRSARVILGRLALVERRDARAALEHFSAALEIEAPPSARDAALLAAAASLAEDEKSNEAAADFTRRFLHKYPRDARRALMAERLERLELATVGDERAR